MFFILHQYYYYLSRQRRVQAVLLLVLTIFGAISEVVSLGSVIPFIGVITNPSAVLETPVLSEIFVYYGLTTADQIIIPVSILFGVAALLAGSIRLLLVWTSIQFVNAVVSDFSIEAYKKVLYQPLAIHVARESSYIISGITQKVGSAGAVLLSFVTAITSLILLISLLITLVYIDTAIASGAIFIFGISYGIVALATKGELTNNSRVIASEQTNVIRVLQEGLGAIRDILLDRSQQAYISPYSHSIRKLRRAQGSNSFINQAPRFIMEMVAMIIVAAFVLVLNNQDNNLIERIPVIAALALGAQRMLPLLQQVYGNWTTIVGNREALEDVLQLLSQSLSKHHAYSGENELNYKDNISFNNIYYKYSDTTPWVIKDLSLSIKKGSITGFIGETGSGKSTLIDLFMGLLDPDKGGIVIDNKHNINDELIKMAWQQGISHVPQNIYLSDKSIKENIAFGVPSDEIDISRVNLVVSQAQLDKFIQGSPLGIDTLVGERGVRLSGGQRQRIGIARALYKKVDVLVLDEATSALDDATEKSVMKSIHDLNPELTIIIIAHRLSTLKKCDRIVKISDGKIKWIQEYSEMINKNKKV
jgi:ATP-binding cassette subfamily B protein